MSLVLSELFYSSEPVKICAPMVRYSKLPFRQLVRKYQCDLAFTPMIIADSFIKSQKARDADFVTNSGDRPLVVQFAATNAGDLADAAELVAPYADGIDLNCGCPQRWAMQEGYGACLLKNPELIKDMVAQVRNRISRDFSCSVKIRVNEDLRYTVDLCQKVERAGVSWITVHGRTPEQRHEPVNLDAIKTVKDAVTVPIVANGDIASLGDVRRVKELTGANGVMAARGLLENPGMFAGLPATSTAVVKDWVMIALETGTPFVSLHHHLMMMLEQTMPKADKRIFNTLTSTTAVLDYLSAHYGILA